MKDDIIRMAREAGLCDEEGRDDSSVIIENHLKRFTALVASAEREACAKVCEEDGLLWGHRYAAAIRSRGQDPMPLFDDWDKDWPK